MNATCLFVYGTLRHDQPEHAQHCRGVTGWRRARVRGRTFRIPAGYRLLVVSPQAVLQHATTDAAADERTRRALTSDAIAAATRAAHASDDAWIDGELLEFREAVEAWPPLDAWENFTPGAAAAVYPRCVVPVEVTDARGAPTLCAAWIYAAIEPPPGSFREIGG